MRVSCRRRDIVSPGSFVSGSYLQLNRLALRIIQSEPGAVARRPPAQRHPVAQLGIGDIGEADQPLARDFQFAPLKLRTLREAGERLIFCRAGPRVHSHDMAEPVLAKIAQEERSVALVGLPGMDSMAQDHLLEIAELGTVTHG